MKARVKLRLREVDWFAVGMLVIIVAYVGWVIWFLATADFEAPHEQRRQLCAQFCGGQHYHVGHVTTGSLGSHYTCTCWDGRRLEGL